MVTELAPNVRYDVIFVVLRYTQLDSALESLRANQTKNIVFVGNNVQARALAAALPEKNILFAFALSAGHREPDRVVSIDLKKITIGQLRGAVSNAELIGEIFGGTKYKVVYEPNMEDYLLCHAAFVMPAAFACYKTDGDLKKLRRNTVYLGRVIDANIEGYRAYAMRDTTFCQRRMQTLRAKSTARPVCASLNSCAPPHWANYVPPTTP